jgi:hypothetical protein
MTAFSAHPAGATTTFVWSGAAGGGNHNMSAGGNWIGGVAPSVGADIVFPDSPTTAIAINDLGFAVNSVDIVGTNYLLEGDNDVTNGFSVEGSVQLRNHGGLSQDTLDCTTFTIAIGGEVQQGGYMTTTVSGLATINGQLDTVGSSPFTAGSFSIGSIATITGQHGQINNDLDFANGGTVTTGYNGDLEVHAFTGHMGSVYQFTPNGSPLSPGIVASGDVTLGDMTLRSESTASDSIKGDVWTLIQNDSAHAVSGTFQGYAEGATVNLSGMLYTISYVGGDGNDVTLTSIQDVWTGNGGDNKWSTAANWAEGVAPSPGDSLVFQNMTNQTTNVNDFANGTSFANITFTNSSSYNISGNDITLTGTLENHSAYIAFHNEVTGGTFLMNSNSSLDSFDGNEVDILGGILTIDTGTHVSGTTATIDSSTVNVDGTFSATNMSTSNSIISVSGTFNGGNANLGSTSFANSGTTTFSALSTTGGVFTDNSGTLTATSLHVSGGEFDAHGTETITTVLVNGTTPVFEVWGTSFTVTSFSETTGTLRVFSPITNTNPVQISGSAVLHGAYTTIGDVHTSGSGAKIELDSYGFQTFGSMSGNSPFYFSIFGTTPGVDQQQLISTGDVSFSNNHLNLTWDAVPAMAVGAQLILINNQGSNPISGALHGINDGDYFTVDDSGTTKYFQYLYNGGDGNDFALKYVGLSIPDPNPSATTGMHLFASDGGVFSLGTDQYYGSAVSNHLSKPIVSSVETPSGNGYWLVASDGGVFSYGDANYFGSTGATHLNKPIVDAIATASGNGYWLIASDGGVFTFGDANYYGSTGNTKLNAPIVAGIKTASGNGYWLIASDGGVFTFGDATYYGSTGDIHLNAPIVSAAPTTTGHGYWLVASDGGVFNFGDANYHGSTGSMRLNAPIVDIKQTGSDAGYWLVGSDGGVFSFGDAESLGSLANNRLNKPIVSVA